VSRAEREVSVWARTTSVPIGISLERAKKRSFLIEILRGGAKPVEAMTICGRGVMTLYGSVAFFDRIAGWTRWSFPEASLLILLILS
jgi:hypothetical protein